MSAEYASVPDAINFMSRITDMCTYFEVNNGVNLKHVMALSDLKLPGD